MTTVEFRSRHCGSWVLNQSNTSFDPGTLSEGTTYYWRVDEVNGAPAFTVHTGDVWSFTVTVRHADTGWEHYADRWDVVAPDGTVLGSRTLFHPHVNEQPFTRSLDNVRIPADVTRVVIRAHDKEHGLGGEEFVLELPTGKGS